MAQALGGRLGRACYCLRSGEGESYRVGGQLVTILADKETTEGRFDLVRISGGKGNTFPLHRAVSHSAIYVLEGSLELQLNDEHFMLTQGDFASIPAGVVQGYEMKSHCTQFLLVTVGGHKSSLFRALGTAYSAPIHPAPCGESPTPEDVAKAGAPYVEVLGSYKPANQKGYGYYGKLPDRVIPYVLEAREGERRLLGDQLHTLLLHREAADNAMLCATAEGPKGLKVIDHYHEHITETFYCLRGRVSVWGDGVEYNLVPGDLVHVPTKGVHAYRLDTHDARFFSVITPGDFVNFFRTVGDPYKEYVYPPVPSPFHADRLFQYAEQLDIHIVGSAAGTRDEIMG
ncbi:quercetin 2,3-dioxygenase [Alicyclobacillus vulcanalis]|uniref:Quercetin 2,3-dioxygenase n=1 Tax=Alicyclobacillus vulcanalis TaxID=252246 RepID=A0A1N7NXI5_9BACL|nr:quercetin 2,3-dioxygenase [Alicyclobacillus vulcanalis]SIT02949.1 quercetin 2,3-dioxygenase [Alicyclobacillus vulcanalis]